MNLFQSQKQLIYGIEYSKSQNQPLKLQGDLAIL